MIDMFDARTRAALLERLRRLEADSLRQWGKMSPAQMCAHCTAALEVATGDTPRKRKLIGWLFGWMVREKLLGEAPFPKNSPTDPKFVIAHPAAFELERARLLSEIEKFATCGPELVATRPHTFLGRLSGREWGVIMGKHLDHHLRQFGL